MAMAGIRCVDYFPLQQNTLRLDWLPSRLLRRTASWVSESGRLVMPVARENQRLEILRWTVTGPSSTFASNVMHLQCSAERPKCAACISQKTHCEYNTAGTDETHSHALKRKYDELIQRNTKYEELYGLLQTRSLEEATEVYKRIRAGDDAGLLLSHIQDGNLLLQMRMVPESRYRYRFLV